MAHSEISWLAGLFEGEGCLTIALTKRKPGGFHLIIQACIVNTDKTIINEATKIFIKNGLDPVVKWRQPKNQPKWKIKGEIHLYGQKKVLALCYLLVDSLRGAKREKAKNIIVFLEDKKDRRTNHCHAKTNTKLLKSIMSSCKNQMKRFTLLQERQGRLYHAF